MNLLLYTFLVTGAWDIILRKYAESTTIQNKPDFVKVLVPYFKKKSVLEAAIIAGIIGFVTQFLILKIVKFPFSLKLKEVVIFLLISFLISGLIGFPLDKGRIIPLLSDTYYKGLGRPRSFFTDGYSGLVVQLSLLFLLNMPWTKSKPL